MKSKKTLLMIILTVVFCVAMGVMSVYAETEKWSKVDIAESYIYGETFVVPERTVTVGNSSVEALSVVTCPSGKVTQAKSLRLGDMGDYTVRYYAKIGSKQYAKEETFSVKGVGYKVKSTLSSVSYGKYSEFGADSEGLNVKLSNKDELEFTKLIDVDGLDRTNAIVKFFITPEQQGTADFDKLTFRLTDAADNSVYLDIEVNRSQFAGNGLGTSWVMAGGNGQDMVGEEAGKMIHVNDNVGTPVNGSFVAQDNSGSWSGPASNHSPDRYIIGLYYDSASNTVYTNSTKVSDLDDPNFYKDLWSGFSSGKARLSVRASGYSGATANFCLTEIFGMTASYLNANTFIDVDAPTVTLPIDRDNVPTAEVGRGYPVPAATAYDDYAGECETDIKVYYGYFSGSPVSVGVKGGSFVPDREGDYAIVYSAKDGFGNSASEVVIVKAVEKIADVKVTLPENLPTEIRLGSYLEFPAATATGGSGEINLETTVIYGGERIAAKKGFRPENAGEYTIEYTAVDYIGKKGTASFLVNATAGDKPVFIDGVTLPPVYISGGKYALPVLYANEYSSGRLNRILCDVKVSDANGVKTYRAGDEFAPTVNSSGDKIGITYIAGNAEYDTISVPVIIGKDGNSVLMSNYIYGEDIIADVRDDNGDLYSSGIAVTPKAGKKKAGWTFANAQVAEGVSFALTTIAGKSDFDKFGFTFVDYADGNRSVTITVEVKAREVVVTHGGNSYSLSSAVKNGGEIAVAYSGGRITVNCNDGESVASVPLKNYDNGEAFNGFPSSRVFFGVYSEGNPTGTKYLVTSVCGNALSYRNNDFNEPSFSVSGDYGGKWEINSVYTIRKGVCGDTFAPSSEVEFTVTAPDGSVVKDLNGKELKSVKPDEDYKILLSSYGKYKIAYAIKEVDWLGNSKPFNITVFVVDEEAPKIEFTSDGTTEATVGDVLIMPNFKVSDNVTAESDIKVSVYVINAQGKLIKLADGANSIKCAYSGKYSFVVCATDAEYNSSSIVWDVIVK